MGGVKGYTKGPFATKGASYGSSYGSAWGKGKVQPTITKTAWAPSKGKGYSSYAPSYSSSYSSGWDADYKGYASYKGKAAPSWGKGYSPKGMTTYGKGKGKGKLGKDRVAPPADSPYWQEKVGAENRQESDGTTYTGIVQNYNVRAGWGFILPDDPTSLPADIQAAITSAAEQAQARGKNVDDANLLYFRKPDVAEGFKAEKGVACTFMVYRDDKGAGACMIGSSA